ncbi:MAG: hypothetical protein M3281_05525 [Chloroflexota bacterium]|nr:hypothetical protein [Chloroflexota bacterium]
MALTGLVDGLETRAADLAPTQWEALRHAVNRGEQRATLRCCGAPARLRTRLGTQHFYHDRREGCEWEPETPEHEAAKAKIVRACLRAGWQARTEQTGAGPGGEWRADVLAWREGVTRKVAFEVQWSHQSAEETRRRQQRYGAASVRGCWFFRRPARELLRADRSLPLFELTCSEDGFLAGVGGRDWPLSELVTALLAGRVRFRERLTCRRERVTLLVVTQPCEVYGEPVNPYAVRRSPLSECGLETHPRLLLPVGSDATWAREEDDRDIDRFVHEALVANRVTGFPSPSEWSKGGTSGSPTSAARSVGGRS